MTGLLVVTALRSEYAALRGQVPAATLQRCGMGPLKVDQWLPRLAELSPETVAIAGVGGGLDPSLRPGDIVVASEVRDQYGHITLPAAAPLVAELRSMGLRVHCGPILSCDHIVTGRERATLATTGALAVDMESATIVRALSARGGKDRGGNERRDTQGRSIEGTDTETAVPVAVVRVIVDTGHQPLNRLATITSGARALAVLRRTGPALGRTAELAGPRTVIPAGPPSDRPPRELRGRRIWSTK